jgi:hypothetical protein
MTPAFLRRHLALQQVRLRRLVLPLLLLVAAVGSGCVSTGTNPVSGDTRAYGYSWKEEVKLGNKTDKQIQQQYGVYDDEGDCVRRGTGAKDACGKPHAPPQHACEVPQHGVSLPRAR